MKNWFIVSKTWVENVFLKQDDRKGSLTTSNDAIEPITWDAFGPLNKPVVLSKNPKRTELFKNMEFVVFDQQQVNI